MRLIGSITAVVCLTLPALAADTAGGAPILNESGSWRFYVTRRPAMVSRASFEAAGMRGKDDTVCPQLNHRSRTDPPPGEWVQPDFDDRDWPRSRADWIGRQASTRAHTHRIALRGKFKVTSPAAAGDLRLSVTYRGGVVVYLNGKEVARNDLPQEDLTPETAARLYPNEFWVDAQGKTLSRRKGLPDRNRSLGPVRLPASALREGVNVLAVEVRRSDFHPAALKWRDFGHPPTTDRWTPVGISEVRLTAAGGGIVANTTRPKGLQAWVEDRTNYMAITDYGDPNEPLGAIRLVGARNGSYCGQIGVGCDGPIRGLTVTAGDLKATGGTSSIPAANVTFLYGRMGPLWCDNLDDTPLPEVPPTKAGGGAVQPVLVRVKVPGTAAPGDYTGAVTASANGTSISVPVELHVADWTVPDPKDFRIYVDLYQSPTTVAMRYNVETWSEEHWKLLEKSWDLLGRAGNRLVIVNAAEETQFGNPRGIIYWVKKPDGSYDYDFSVFDRYVRMALDKCGRLDHVAVQVWHVGNLFKTGSGWGASALNQKVTVTVKDPRTGALSSLRAPTFATDESKRFWKPFLAAVDGRLRKMGLKGTLCLGILMDSIPSMDLFTMFDEIWPDGNKSRWMRGCHVATGSTGPYPPRRRGAGLVVLHEYCYGGGVRNPKFGEARNYPGVFYFRASNEYRIPLTMYLAFGDFSLAKGTKGVGRICLDFWRVMKGRRGQRRDIINRYPESDCMQRRPAICRMSWPGPRGAMPTVRMEAFIEGLQETEAVIVIAEALDKHRDRLGADLAARCEQILKDRETHWRLTWSQYENRSYGLPVLHPHHHGWQPINRRLYACAADVAKKTRQ